MNYTACATVGMARARALPTGPLSCGSDRYNLPVFITPRALSSCALMRVLSSTKQSVRSQKKSTLHNRSAAFSYDAQWHSTQKTMGLTWFDARATLLLIFNDANVEQQGLAGTTEPRRLSGVAKASFRHKEGFGLTLEHLTRNTHWTIGWSPFWRLAVGHGQGTDRLTKVQTKRINDRGGQPKGL